MSTSTDKLFELINTDGEPPFPLTSAMITLGEPVADSAFGKNSKITVTAQAGSGLTGDRDVFYDRIPLSATGTGLLLQSLVDFTPDIIYGFLVNDRNATLLDREDLETIDVPSLTVMSLPTPVTITASPNSFGWVDQTTITLKRDGTQEELANGVNDYVVNTMTQTTFW